MSHTANTKYLDRIKTLKRRRDFLDARVTDYHGKDMSRDKAEASAIDWALEVIEAHSGHAIDLIRQHIAAKDATQAPQHQPNQEDRI